MSTRIPGFDLARAYAILGMFIVNFNTVFGSISSEEGWFGVLRLFNGNSSSLFVILSGMGVSLMTHSSLAQKERRPGLKAVVMKRSWFLFLFGLLFFLWWPADILHFYGGYMHLAAFLLFVPRSWYLWAAALALVVFHVLFALIPYDRGWDFQSMLYVDFWTVNGFLRNTFYNGWNPVFPWIAFFFLGMYLGRLNWQLPQTPWRIMFTGAAVYILNLLVQWLVRRHVTDPDTVFYFTADYLPPFIPFMLGTASFSMVLTGLCVLVGRRSATKSWLRFFAQTGQMTLTHYVSHLSLGFFVFSWITGKALSLEMIHEPPVHPLHILGFSVVYFLFSCLFSLWWKRTFAQGPLEMIMRWFSDRRWQRLEEPKTPRPESAEK